MSLANRAWASGLSRRMTLPTTARSGRRIQVFRGVAVLHRDAQAFQKGAHGRVGVFVGAADPVALFFEDAGQGRHAGAADAYKMNMCCNILFFSKIVIN